MDELKRVVPRKHAAADLHLKSAISRNNRGSVPNSNAGSNKLNSGDNYLIQLLESSIHNRQPGLVEDKSFLGITAS